MVYRALRCAAGLFLLISLDPSAVRIGTTFAAAAAFQSSSNTDHATSLLPPSISDIPFTKFEKSEQMRAFQEIRNSCLGCWSGSISILELQAQNAVKVREPPARNFRLRVDLKGRKGTWTVWNLNKEGDEVVVPLRLTPVERPSQYKVGFPGIILRIPCAITEALPRIVFEIGFWDAQTRKTSVLEYVPDVKWWSSRAMTEHPWRLDSASLVQMKRQPKRGFVGPMTDPRAVAFLPIKAPFSIKDWDWKLWEPIRTERVDFVTEERTENRLDDDEVKEEVYARILQAFDQTDSSRFVRLLPNSILTSLPYRLDPSPQDTVRAVFAQGWDDDKLAVVEVEYQGRVAKTACLHTFQKRT